MSPVGTAIRTAFLAIFSVSLVGGAIATDYYLRHEETRKAQRFLQRQGVEISVDSAIERAKEGRNDLLEQLELAGVNLGAGNENRVTPVLAALREGQDDTVEYLLVRSNVIETVNMPTIPEGDTAMAHTLRERDFNYAKRLNQVGSSLDCDRYPGVPFLIDAIKNDDREMVEFLLSNGADPNYRGTQSFGASALASEADDMELLQLLADSEADFDVMGTTGVPLLIEATEDLDYDKVEFFLANGANVNITSSSSGEGYTPAGIAVSKRDGRLTKSFFAAGANPESVGPRGGTVLFEAGDDGDLETVIQLLEYGANANGTGPTGEPVLTRAVKNEDLDMVEVLLNGGAKPNEGAEGAERPLFVAIENGNMAISRMLIEEGADLDKQTMLAKAYETRDDPLMNLLLNAGTDPESTLPGSDERVFDVAVREGNTSAVRTLLNAGANVGDNLWAALLTKQVDLLGVILSGGADPMQRNNAGETPLSYALGQEQYKSAKLLLNAGANPNVMYDDAESWLARSIRLNIPDVAEALVRNGATITGVRCRDGHTLIGWAIANEMSDVAVALIEAGIDVEEFERTPATESFKSNFKSTTFKYHLTNDDRIRPLYIAASKKDHKVAQALKDAGAKSIVYTRKSLYPINIPAWYSDVEMMQIILLGRAPEVQPRKVLIDLSSQRMTLYEGGVATYSSRCSTGKRGKRTRTGNFVITDKHRHHTSSIYGSSMPFFQRVSCSDFGLHQGYVPGYPASSGCIRLPYSAAAHMFRVCKVGDLVVIQQ